VLFADAALVTWGGNLPVVTGFRLPPVPPRAGEPSLCRAALFVDRPLV